MRFKLDENLPRLAREQLAEHGWEVHDAYDEGLAGAVDSDIQTVCEHEGRILVTLDSDFADVRRCDPVRSPGVIVLWPRDQSIQSCLECLRAAIRALGVERITGTLWIVEPQRIRIRDHPLRCLTALSCRVPTFWGSRRPFRSRISLLILSLIGLAA